MLRILECNVLERDEYELSTNENIVAIFHAIFYLNFVDFWEPSICHYSVPNKTAENVILKYLQAENPERKPVKNGIIASLLKTTAFQLKIKLASVSILHMSNRSSLNNNS